MGWAEDRYSSYMLRNLNLNLGSEELRGNFEPGRDRVTLE